MFFGNDAERHHIIRHQGIGTLGFDVDRVVINFDDILAFQVGHET